VPDDRTAVLAALGDRMRSGRDRLGISQDQLAERARLHRTYVAGLEVGRRNPSLTVLAKLARGLGVDLGDLLRGLQEQVGPPEGP
jgi:transcriptional regulator with XRE-family HTH domain